MSEATVRRYDPRDRRAVWVVHDRALRAAWDAYNPEYNRYLRHVERAFVDVGGVFLVADAGVDADATPVSDSGVVAIGGFQPLASRGEGSLPEFVASLTDDVSDTAQVRSVAVAPDWQGAGVGTELVRGLERRAADAGFDRVVLQSPGALPGTHRFYESLGYRAFAGGVSDADTQAGDYVWFYRRL